jgi:hypothetical protein
MVYRSLDHFTGSRAVAPFAFAPFVDGVLGDARRGALRVARVPARRQRRRHAPGFRDPRREKTRRSPVRPESDLATDRDMAAAASGRVHARKTVARRAPGLPDGHQLLGVMVHSLRGRGVSPGRVGTGTSRQDRVRRGRRERFSLGCSSLPSPPSRQLCLAASERQLHLRLVWAHRTSRDLLSRRRRTRRRAFGRSGLARQAAGRARANWVEPSRRGARSPLQNGSHLDKNAAVNSR